MRRDLGLGCLLFLTFFALYLHGTYPSVAAGDSGEFATVASVLGVPHPSGFPLFTIFGHAFVSIVAWATHCFRLNAFSAACGALTAVTLFGVLRRCTVSIAGSLAAAILFAISPAVMVSAQGTEVFALHSALCGLALWGAVSGAWGASLLTTGLACANHQTALFLVPGIVCGYWSWRGDHSLSEQRAILWTSIIAFVVGLTPYAFVYVRAAKHPFLNIGDAETVYRWWRVITRADYGSLTLALGDAPARTLLNTTHQLLRLGIGLTTQLGIIGLLVMALGIVFAALRRRSIAIAPAVAFFLLGPFFAVLGNLPFDAQSTSLLERFYVVPTYLFVAVGMMGLDAVMRKRPPLAWAFFILPALALITAPPLPNFRSDFRAYAYGRNNLRALPPQSTFVMDGGDDTFYTLSYLTQAEHRRTDIRLWDRGGVVFPGLYGPDFRRLPHDEKEPRRQIIEGALASAKTPFSMSTMNVDLTNKLGLHRAAFLYASANSPSTPWEVFDFRGVAPWIESSSALIQDYRTRALAAFYAFQKSADAAAAAQWPEAVHWLDSAHTQGADIQWLIPNTAVSLHQWAYGAVNRGELPTAIAMYERLVTWMPDDPLAWSNLGSVYQRLNRIPEAIRCAEHAIALNPSSAEAHFNLAVTLWHSGDWAKVVHELQAVLQINPRYPNAAGFLMRAEQNIKKP